MKRVLDYHFPMTIYDIISKEQEKTPTNDLPKLSLSEMSDMSFQTRRA
jgi:hypothetical protein